MPFDCQSKQQLSTAGVISNTLSSGSDEMASGTGRKELEKRRRSVVVSEDDELIDEVASLNLKLGGQLYPIM